MYHLSAVSWNEVGMDHVFLSYRSTEEAFASRLRDDLVANGIPVWMDQHGGIDGGDDWRQSIEDALDHASTLIAVVSPGYLESKWCRRELNRADQNNIPIIPVYIEPIGKTPLVIEGIQYIDFREAQENDQTYRQQFLELVNQIQEKASLETKQNEVKITSSNYRKRLRRPAGGTMYSIMMLVLTVVSIGIAALTIPDERLRLITTGVRQIFRPVHAPLFEPTLEELSLAVREGSLKRDLDDVSSPQDLVTAPTSEGVAIWGYGTANQTLFAVDVGTGEQTTTLNLPDLLGNNFLPASLHFDNTWLWLGDARNDLVVALDPQSPEDEPIQDYALNGDPRSMAHTGKILWVALPDANQVVALTIDHENARVSDHCEGISVDAPDQLFAAEQATVWVTHDGGYSQINVQSCQIMASYPVESRVDALYWMDGTLLLTAGGNLYQHNEGDESPILVALPDDINVVDVLMTDGTIWLATQDNRLLNFDPESNSYQVEIGGNTAINSLIRNGRQIWAAREDNSLTRYIMPDYVYPDLVEIAWVDETLWVVDENLEICGIRDDQLRCHAIDSEADPITLMATDTALWLGLSNNRLLQISPENGEIVDQVTVTAIGLPEAVVEMDGTLWVSDLFTATTVVNLENGNQAVLESINVLVPNSITYDGTNMWFANTSSDQVFTVERDGSRVWQGQSFSVPIGNEVYLLADGEAVTAITTGSIYVIAPTSGDVEHIIGIGAVDDVATGPNGPWIADRDTGFIYQASAE